ncbi:TlpA family protein disulfide reductase [Rhodohalobacter sp. SW132]|uniref:TlpA family protein disulfide reductase n=1 Tax=Rhodohalobacter sp. SW132 TaxID=2293433 RepID=UPI000E22465B|nr:TlpA disulfide reductase family protein [Rhodohalobacter sp. SW132]REL33615.1 TlpA family protein disulfide reductase [Rhodohalobacter sp. SW132]
MRLDPKYFNLFLVVCAAITALVIVFSTVRYVSNQQETFREEIREADLSSWNLYRYTEQDSVTVEQFSGSPVVVHFWSTWSGMSMEVNQVLSGEKQNRPELIIVAAASRDGDEQVLEYIDGVNYDFVFVNGTSVYQDLMVPGMPSLLFINRKGEIVDHLVGKDTDEMVRKIEQLLDEES